MTGAYGSSDPSQGHRIGFTVPTLAAREAPAIASRDASALAVVVRGGRRRYPMTPQPSVLDPRSRFVLCRREPVVYPRRARMGSMLGRVVDVDLGDVDGCCRANLHEGATRIIFQEGYLSTVLAVEATSGRQVIVKIRRPAERLQACATVHRRVFVAGFACPQPLVGPEQLGPYLASAETLISGGELWPTSGRSPTRSPMLWRRSSRRPRTQPRCPRWNRRFYGPARLADNRFVAKPRRP
jgi:hypothetical protein